MAPEEPPKPQIRIIRSSTEVDTTTPEHLTNRNQPKQLSRRERRFNKKLNRIDKKKQARERKKFADAVFRAMDLR